MDKRFVKIREIFTDRLLTAAEVLLNKEDMVVILKMIEESRIGQSLVTRLAVYVIGRSYGIIPPPENKNK